MHAKIGIEKTIIFILDNVKNLLVHITHYLLKYQF
jgi:hypothetical protein